MTPTLIIGCVCFVLGAAALSFYLVLLSFSKRLREVEYHQDRMSQAFDAIAEELGLEWEGERTGNVVEMPRRGA